MRVLGANCSTRAVNVAVVQDGNVLDGLPERLRPAQGIELGDRLLEFIDDVARLLAQVRPDRVALLLPEAQRRGSASYQSVAPRLTIETLFRVASAREGYPLRLIARPSVRAALDLPKKGSLDDHLESAGEPVGRYWRDGRGLAALAALAEGAH
ncbi:hypothetical protein [Ilumatobacter sp.]|uniref:hypothetical protein n=1 Tax=Ilumatobacter sp. TaxID=1967498 RepID=UPI003B52FB83